MTENKVRIVLVGAGYTSVWAYRAIRRWAGRRTEVVVVTPHDVHTFHGFTGEVIAGELPTWALDSPLHEVFPAARLVRGTVTRVDRDARSVQVRGTDGEFSVLAYDHLVVGAGAYDRTGTAPGLSDHAFQLRGPGDAARLQAHLADVAARSLHADDAERLRTVVVVGAGIAGVEFAAAAALAPLPAPLRVVLVSGRATIADELAASGSLVSTARRWLDELGVEVLLGRRVTAATSEGVRLDDGTELPAATVVAATGSEGRPLPGLQDCEVDARGRLVVSPSLQVDEHVWAGGDAASFSDVRGGAAPSMAAAAIASGTAIGRNIARVTAGRAPRPFAFDELGRAAALGSGRGLMNFKGLVISGWPAWLGRVGFFLWYVPSRPHAVRIVRHGFSRNPAGGSAPAQTRVLPRHEVTGRREGGFGARTGGEVASEAPTATATATAQPAAS